MTKNKFGAGKDILNISQIFLQTEASNWPIIKTK